MFLDVLFGVLPLFFVMIVGYAASYAPKFPSSVEPQWRVGWPIFAGGAGPRALDDAVRVAVIAS